MSVAAMSVLVQSLHVDCQLRAVRAVQMWSHLLQRPIRTSLKTPGKRRSHKPQMATIKQGVGLIYYSSNVLLTPTKVHVISTELYLFMLPQHRS